MPSRRRRGPGKRGLPPDYPWHGGGGYSPWVKPIFQQDSSSSSGSSSSSDDEILVYKCVAGRLGGNNLINSIIGVMPSLLISHGMSKYHITYNYILFSDEAFSQPLHVPNSLTNIAWFELFVAFLLNHLFSKLCNTLHINGNDVFSLPKLRKASRRKAASSKGKVSKKDKKHGRKEKKDKKDKKAEKKKTDDSSDSEVSVIPQHFALTLWTF